MLYLILFGAFVVLLLAYFYRNSTESKNVKGQLCRPLPGPFCLPFVGYLPLFITRQRPYIFLTELGRKYGPIFRIRLGSQNIVVLNTLPIIKQALNEWSFSSRPDLPTLRAIKSDGQFDRMTFLPYGPKWKFYRKNVFKALALFSTSRNSRLRKVVEEGCRSLWHDIDQHLGRPFFVKDSIFECVAGIIGAINFGVQFDRQSRLMRELIGFTERSAAFLKLASFLDYFPACHFFMTRKLHQLRTIAEPVNELVHYHLTNRSFDRDHVADVADALFKQTCEIGEGEYRSLGLTPQHLMHVSQDLFIAGFITTMETFVWGLTLMAQHPTVQKTVQQELDNLYKNNVQVDKNEENSFPKVDDKSATPYTEATILEIFRFSSLTPVALPHATWEDCVVLDYYIPKDSIVLPNLWAVHHDPTTFPDPNKFDPSRFLDNNGQVDIDFAQNVVPFSVGKRRCIGENLARQELYLLFSSTIQRYEVGLDPKQDLNFDRDVVDGIARIVKQPVELIFKRR